MYLEGDFDQANRCLIHFHKRFFIKNGEQGCPWGHHFRGESEVSDQTATLVPRLGQAGGGKSLTRLVAATQHQVPRLGQERGGKSLTRPVAATNSRVVSQEQKAGIKAKVAVIGPPQVALL